MKTKLEPQIDELYKLPLDAFTKARNALAKTLSGNDKKVVASLVKPSLAMWVVNQLYWQDAPTYKALVDASEKLRAAHRAALNGRKVDTRKPDEMHQTTLEKAFAKAAALAQKNGVALTDTVRDTVRRTLAALPTDEAPGRLTREPAAVGFSLLTGIKPRQLETKPKKEDEKKTEEKPNPRQLKLKSSAAMQLRRKRGRKKRKHGRKKKDGIARLRRPSRRSEKPSAGSRS